MSEKKHFYINEKIIGSLGSLGVNSEELVVGDYWLSEKGVVAPLCLLKSKSYAENVCRRLNELYDELQELKDCPVECDVSECLEDCDALLKGYVNNLEEKNRRLEIENKLLERIITDNIKVDNHKGGSFSTSVFPYDMVKTCKVDKEGNVTFKF